ncbi:hypothetical protein EIP91_004810 [Steccherinum ochraceum]|uniref:CCHC-type domain-containing protein n=1 Tax=Steccherinum ochraceum TaxID=92696 RepID=A0A4R0R836_9APHY|nr:hypothetical protein EIP91_004810 [Steccherinum ochraceum]
MVSQTQEVIDLTQSPKPDIIILDSDSDHRTTTKTSRKPSSSGSSSRETNKFSLLDRIADASQENGERSGEGAKKKRKKKKKKAAVVEGEVVVAEVEEMEGSEGEVEEVSAEWTNGHKVNRKEKEREPKPSSSRGVHSLLGRLADADQPGQGQFSSSGKRKSSDTDAPSEGEIVEPEPKKRKRRERQKQKARDKERDRSRSRSPQPSSRRRSRSRERRRDDGPSSSKDTSSLFFISEPSQPVASGSGSKAKAEEEDASLLLPAHVALVGDTIGIPVQIIAPPSPLDSDEEDYIDYIDYGDDGRKAPGLVRYFEDPAELADETEAKPKRLVCKHCGAMGEHSSWNCPVIICLTCGARDEHSTRGCPISKVCFACGMKGHTKNACPNRYGRGRGTLDSYDECDRCGSGLHQTKECPTLWRMYEYVDDNDRQEILRSREQKAELNIGEGGEGYIARDEWCYNCGEIGHLGDDCDEPHPYDVPKESSAFGSYNVSSGPFFDPTAEPERPKKRKKPTAKDAEEWGDAHGFVLPLDVGKQARRKEKDRLARKARDAEPEGEDDWFNGSGSRGGGGGRSKPSLADRIGGKGPPSMPKKMQIGKIAQDESRFSRGNSSNRGDRDQGRSRYDDDLPRPGRETDSIQIRGASKRYPDDRSSDL